MFASSQNDPEVSFVCHGSAQECPEREFVFASSQNEPYVPWLCDGSVQECPEEVP